MTRRKREQINGDFRQKKMNSDFINQKEFLEYVRLGWLFNQACGY